MLLSSSFFLSPSSFDCFPPSFTIRRVTRLRRQFYNRPTLEVARDLLGQQLVRLWRGRRLAGLVTEVEAYIGQSDLACHARFGRTPRAEVMFGPPGHAYVYFTYGMHWMLNCVTEAKDFPAAVLIRAIQPLEGVDIMRRRRARPDKILTNGPAKLTQALNIARPFNGHDLCASDAALFVERVSTVPDSAVVCGPRVGLGDTPEPWLSQPWNFKVSVK
jgi:DNA-3-methyladenine glycosylase